MTLRGKKPQDRPRRLKLMVYGPAGVGKTVAAIQMPSPYLIDTEGGAVHYGDTIERSGGVVFETISLDEVEAEIRALMTEDHPYRTVVIDPFTTIYADKVAEGEGVVGTEYGRHFGYANTACRRLFNLLAMVDMNVVVTCHAKAVYGDGMKIIGETFDAWKKLDYLFDLVVQLQRRGKDNRIGIVRKTRLEGFPDLDEFPWSYDEIAARFGAGDLVREVETVELATVEQLQRLDSLLDILKTDPKLTDKWLKAAKVDRFADMTSEHVGKCILYLEQQKEAA